MFQRIGAEAPLSLLVKAFLRNYFLMVTTKTANHPKSPETTRSHPKPSETSKNFLQPTTNYPGLAIISLKPPETPNNQPLNAFS